MTDQQPVHILASHSASRAIKQELTRRRFLSLAAAVGTTAALAACGSGKSGETTSTVPTTAATGGPLEGSLSIYTWGDYEPPSVTDAFTADLGPKIQLDSYGSMEEAIAKLVAAKGTSGYDIVIPTGLYIPEMVHNGLLAKFNKDLIPNLSNVDPAFLGANWDLENEFSVIKAFGSTGFVYDTKAIKRDLTTWDDFIDAMQNEASGKTSMVDDPSGITGLYFWSRGEDWNSTDPAKLDDVEKFALDVVAPNVAAFDSYPGAGAIPSATYSLMQAWSGDARMGILASEDPERWQWVLGSPGTEKWADNYSIVAGAPHPEAAHAFINFVLSPEKAIEELDYIGLNTGVIGLDALAEKRGLERLDMIFFTPEQLATMEYGEHNEAQQRRVEIWNKTKVAAG